MRSLLLYLSGLWFLPTLAMGAAPEFVAQDDAGRQVSLAEPPQRIISMAPHLTEMLFELGVQDRIIATVKHSDYPPAARQIPRLGDAFSISIEAVINLSPDLILAWTTGGNQRTLAQLESLGYPVYQNESANLLDIASSVRRIGVLVGEPVRGDALAKMFEQELDEIIRARESTRRAGVFFQISDAQLYTVNDQHLIGQAISACGARNVFGDLNLPVPLVSLESVVNRDPDFVVVSVPQAGATSQWDATWDRLGWTDRLRTIDASLITRPGLRMLMGIKSLCNLLD